MNDLLPPPPPRTPPRVATRSTPSRRRHLDDALAPDDVDSRRKTKLPKPFVLDEEGFMADCRALLFHGGATSAASEPTPVDKNNRYLCGLCPKGFSSYQALSDHETRHRNNPGGSRCGVNIGRHVCSICYKAFQTGQQLGGHKRKHYRGVLKGRKDGANSGRNISQGVGSSSCVTSSSSCGGDTDGNGDVTPARRSLDLYSPPPTGLDLTLHL